MGTKLEEKPDEWAVQAELGCSACKGKIVIGIPRSKVTEPENKLTKMPDLTDPRWQVIISSCRCDDE